MAGKSGPSLSSDPSPSSGSAFKKFTVLEAKETYPYVIPSFPVITVNLRHVKYQMVDEHGDVHAYDGFMRECPAMHRTFPAIALVRVGYKFAFVVEVRKPFILCHKGLTATYCPLLLQESEFGLCIDIPGANLPMGKVFVIWKFSWYDQVEHNDQSDGSDTSGEHDSMATQSEDSSEESEREGEKELNVTHTVTFKCIGSVRDMASQEVLSKASAKWNEGGVVPLGLTPEPTNPKDSKAIAFECLVSDKWERIGYVVKEALDSVHCALSESKILSVQFDWIKYIVYWYRSGPGWYAGIKITRKGNWSTDVVRSKSKEF